MGGLDGYIWDALKKSSKTSQRAGIIYWSTAAILMTNKLDAMRWYNVGRPDHTETKKRYLRVNVKNI